MIVSPATLQGFQWLRVAGLSFMPVRQHKGRVVCDNFRKRLDETGAAAGIAEWPPLLLIE